MCWCMVGRGDEVVSATPVGAGVGDDTSDNCCYENIDRDWAESWTINIFVTGWSRGEETLGHRQWQLLTCVQSVVITIGTPVPWRGLALARI